MLLAPASASCDTNSSVKSTIVFIRLRQLKQHFGNVMILIWFQCHMMPAVSSMAWHHLFNKDSQNDVQHDFLSCHVIGTTWCHWHWSWCHLMPLYWYQHHVMWAASSMAPLHSLHQDDHHEAHCLALAIAKKTLDENHFRTAQKTIDRKPPFFNIGNRAYFKNKQPGKWDLKWRPGYRIVWIEHYGHFLHIETKPPEKYGLATWRM